MCKTSTSFFYYLCVGFLLLHCVSVSAYVCVCKPGVPQKSNPQHIEKQSGCWYSSLGMVAMDACDSVSCSTSLCRMLYKRQKRITYSVLGMVTTGMNACDSFCLFHILAQYVVQRAVNASVLGMVTKGMGACDNVSFSVCCTKRRTPCKYQCFWAWAYFE